MFLIFLVAGFCLIASSIVDLRTGEVPDTLSVGFSAAILLIAAGYSTIAWNADAILTTIGAGAAYFLLGYIAFRLGQWGGGDVKILAGIGCTLGLLDSTGFAWPNSTYFPYTVTYIVNMAAVATPYVILYGLALGFGRPDVNLKFLQKLREKTTIAVFLFTLSPLILSIYMGYHTLTLVYSTIPVFFIFSLYLKSVEKVALQKRVKVKDLREGDMLAEDIIVNGEVKARGKMIEGITAQDLELLRGLHQQGKVPDEILIRWGIRFVPIFLTAFLVTLYFGNFLELLFSVLVL